MRTHPRSAGVVVAALSLAVALAACGEAGQSEGPAPAEDGLKIGVLMPDSTTARWETFDGPLIQKKIEELCGDCTVERANAQGEVGAQQQQVDSMITRGIRVLVLSPVDAKSLRASVKKADDANIPVVAYDRLVEGPISAYVSFDGVEIGRLQGEALLKALRDRAEGYRIVMMNGDATDPNAASFKKGALSVLQDLVTIGKMYDTAGWKPDVANTNMSGAIAALGALNIDGVYSANDGLASGIISALKANNISPLPPVTGQDAELAGVQRIVSGDQYMSVYKPFKPEADAAAEMAVTLARGEQLQTEDRVSSPTTKEVPAVLLTPISLTVENIRDTVIKDGMYTIDQVCTQKFRSACERAGLIP
ncbi:sugar ABC transporter substrate-binding protein [Streptomyces sp. KR80]|uniref:sugar ABC transporter substrate-binding protein n=1 Tax=Streptomyces sp. KR80 TaxID=3457426 RepID=UPI003FD0035C